MRASRARVLVVECNCGHEFELTLDRQGSVRETVRCPQCHADSGVRLDKIARSYFAALVNVHGIASSPCEPGEAEKADTVH